MTASAHGISSTQVLNERYQLDGLIGKGGMGSVYRAKDTVLGGVIVAVKVLFQPLIDEKMHESFANEARLCAMLSNKSMHVVKVMDYGIYDNEYPYYVMEYLPGQSLRALLQPKPLDLSDFLLITRQVCLGLEAAHGGIELEGRLSPVIHRDIKPANIFISPDPILGKLVKVLDFGIAKFFSDHSCMTQTNTYIGTLAYSSPEQIEGAYLDIRSDIYSLGVMMYEMLAGAFPWKLASASFGAWYKAHQYEQPTAFAETKAKVEVPATLEDLVMSCLAKQPSKRPQSMRQVIEILAEIQAQINADIVAGSSEDKSLRNAKSQAAEAGIPNPNPFDGFLKTYQFSLETNNRTAPKDFHKNPPRDSREAETRKRPPVDIRVSIPKNRLSTIEEQLCWDTLWPKSRPIAEIVLPNYVKSRDAQNTLPSLWVMLSTATIYQYASSVTYNHFLFAKTPYPMLLWLTAMYNTEQGIKFFPCYLDMKKSLIQKFTHSLAEKGYYGLLCFSLEKPNGCKSVRKIQIKPTQCKLLKQWIEMSCNSTAEQGTTQSKQLLTLEYKKLKAKIVTKIEAALEQQQVQQQVHQHKTVAFDMSNRTSNTWLNETNYKTIEWF